MKTAFYGRIVFGGSAVLFGVIALMWHDSDTWQTLRQIWSLPFGTIIGGCLMTAQIASGIGMQYPGTARSASVVLGVVYSLFSLACIPGIIAASTIYAHYGSFFEQFSLLCSTRLSRRVQGNRGSDRPTGTPWTRSLCDFIYAESGVLPSFHG